MGALDWSASAASMWSAQLACLATVLVFSRGGQQVLSLNALWASLAVLFVAQIVVGFARVVSGKGPWVALGLGGADGGAPAEPKVTGHLMVRLGAAVAVRTRGCGRRYTAGVSKGGAVWWGLRPLRRAGAHGALGALGRRHLVQCREGKTFKAVCCRVVPSGRPVAVFTVTTVLSAVSFRFLFFQLRCSFLFIEVSRTTVLAGFWCVFVLCLWRTRKVGPIISRQQQFARACSLQLKPPGGFVGHPCRALSTYGSHKPVCKRTKVTLMAGCASSSWLRFFARGSARSVKSQQQAQPYDPHTPIVPYGPPPPAGPSRILWPTAALHGIPVGISQSVAGMPPRLAAAENGGGAEGEEEEEGKVAPLVTCRLCCYLLLLCAGIAIGMVANELH